MGNKITEIRYRKIRNGIELQGIARSDRGTKYIEDSLVIPLGPGGKYPSRQALEAGVKQLYDAEKRT